MRFECVKKIFYLFFFRKGNVIFISLWFSWLILPIYSRVVIADEVTPSIAKIINKQSMTQPSWSSSVEANNNLLMGDKFDFASGKVQFQHTDIELPGNSALEVAIRRTLYTADLESSISEIAVQSHFSDWVLVIRTNTFGHLAK